MIRISTEIPAIKDCYLYDPKTERVTNVVRRKTIKPGRSGGYVLLTKYGTRRYIGQLELNAIRLAVQRQIKQVDPFESIKSEYLAIMDNGTISPKFASISEAREWVCSFDPELFESARIVQVVEVMEPTVKRSW